MINVVKKLPAAVELQAVRLRFNSIYCRQKHLPVIQVIVYVHNQHVPEISYVKIRKRMPEIGIIK